MKYLNKKYQEKRGKIIEMLLLGKTCKETAKEFGVSQQRIHQVAKESNIDLWKNRRGLKTKLAEHTFIPLIESHDLKVIRKKLDITNSKVSNLRNYYGIDMRVNAGDYINRRYKICYDLYMEGYNAYEIVDILKKEYGYVIEVGSVYTSVKRHANVTVLPKRLNKKTIASNTLDKEITKLFKKGKNDKEILSILIGKGFKNVDGGELKLPVITWRLKKLNLIK
jgi:transposase